MLHRPSQRKTVYPLLLLLLGTGTFGLFSDYEVGFLLKVSGMLVFLLSGSALLYFGVYLKSHRQQRQKRQELDKESRPR